MTEGVVRTPSAFSITFASCTGAQAVAWSARRRPRTTRRRALRCERSQEIRREKVWRAWVKSTAPPLTDVGTAGGPMFPAASALTTSSSVHWLGGSAAQHELRRMQPMTAWLCGRRLSLPAEPTAPAIDAHRSLHDRHAAIRRAQVNADDFVERWRGSTAATLHLLSTLGVPMPRPHQPSPRQNCCSNQSCM